MLTVAIPTYNRNAVLYRSLERLLPQMTPESRLLILDNHSDTPVAETLAPLLAQHPNAQVKIVRNPTNVGSCANILRCFEMTETKYVWVLGDDDYMVDDAIGTIFDHIARYPDCSYFHFSSYWLMRDKTEITTGRHDYVTTFGTVANLFFLSAAVYDTEMMKGYLRFGYAYAYSLVPHLVVLLMALGDDKKACIAEAPLIVKDPSDPPLNVGWSEMDLMLGKMTVMELPIPYETLKILGRMMAHRPTIEYVVVYLTKQGVAKGGHQPWTHYYDQICSRVFVHTGWFTRLKIPLYRPLVRFPKVGKFVTWVIGTVLRKPGFTGKQIIIWDRFVRM